MENSEVCPRRSARLLFKRYWTCSSYSDNADYCDTCNSPKRKSRKKKRSAAGKFKKCNMNERQGSPLNLCEASNGNSQAFLTNQAPNNEVVSRRGVATEPEENLPSQSNLSPNLSTCDSSDIINTPWVCIPSNVFQLASMEVDRESFVSIETPRGESSVFTQSEVEGGIKGEINSVFVKHELSNEENTNEVTIVQGNETVANNSGLNISKQEASSLRKYLLYLYHSYSNIQGYRLPEDVDQMNSTMVIFRKDLKNYAAFVADMFSNALFNGNKDVYKEFVMVCEESIPLKTMRILIALCINYLTHPHEIPLLRNVPK